MLRSVWSRWDDNRELAEDCSRDIDEIVDKSGDGEGQVRFAECSSRGKRLRSLAIAKVVNPREFRFMVSKRSHIDDR